MVVAPLVAAVPVLVTTNVEVRFWPTGEAGVWRLASVRSGTPPTTVKSASRSLAAERSLAVLTLAALVIAGKADRKSVVEGKRVDVGGRGIVKTKVEGTSGSAWVKHQRAPASGVAWTAAGK